MNITSYENSTKLAIIIFIPGIGILTIFSLGTNYVIASNGTEIGNNTENFIIEYTRSGGQFFNDSQFVYNSTDNHLLSTYANGTRSDETLPKDQQKNLTQTVMNGNFFDVSFNSSSTAHDAIYHTLEIRTSNQTNMVSWNDADSFAKTVPVIVEKIVGALFHIQTVNTSNFYVNNTTA